MPENYCLAARSLNHGSGRRSLLFYTEIRPRDPALARSTVLLLRWGHYVGGEPDILYLTRAVGLLQESSIAGVAEFPPTHRYASANFKLLAAKNERIPLP